MYYELMNCKTKAISATCEEGKVFINGAEVPQAVILSAGQAKSTGCAVFSGPDVFYVAVPVGTLNQLIGLMTALTDTLTSGILASNTGGPITSGSFAAELAQLKAELNSLKGGMQ